MSVTSTPYSGRGAHRVLMIPKDEPVQDLDVMSRVWTMLNTSTLPAILYRIPDSACVVVHLGHIVGTSAQITELRDLFSEFGDCLFKNIFVVEGPEKARMYAAAKFGFEFDAGAPLRWQHSRCSVPDKVSSKVQLTEEL